MKEKLQALTELQKVDLEVAQLRKSHEVHPKQLAELERELAQTTGELEAERNRVAEVERQRRSLEQNIADEKDKVKKWEARLAEQRSTREYSALAREIDIAKKANATMAEELVELGKSLASAREGLKAKEAATADREAQLRASMEALRGRMSEAESQVQVLEARRGEAAGSVDRTLLQRYESVRRKKLPALVPLRGTACTGCNRSVPPQLANTLRVTLGTDVCPNCHRIIYSPEALGTDASAAK